MSGGDAGVELRSVALEIGADQIPPVDETVFIAFGKEAEREAAPNPQTGRGLEDRFDFEDIEGTEGPHTRSGRRGFPTA